MAAMNGTGGGTKFLPHEMMVPPVKLTEALNLRELSSESGTLFEVASQPTEDYCPQQQQANFFDDISLISSLSLMGTVDEDENNLSDAGDEEPFERLAHRMMDISGDGGVLKMEVKAGVGEAIPERASVTFHYTAFLEHNDEPFDSSLLRGFPDRKLLDVGELLPGLNLAIKTMRCGETSRFLIWPHYAFGKTGCPPRIPGGAVLLYEVQLVSAVDHAAADSFQDLDVEKQNTTTFKEKLEAAQAYHRQGNHHYSEGNISGAKNSYYRAAWIMENCALKDREEELQRGHILIRLRSNLAQVYLELKEPARACTQCKMGLSVTGEHSKDIIAKLNFRLGKAKGLLNDFSGAKKFLHQALSLKPGCDEIIEELEAVVKREEKWAARERFMCQQMFNSSATAEHKGQASGMVPRAFEKQ
ncbi:inactive peptidyl-prolyl cis-trans isomerase FKBP6-like [Portunus trituberculatus]|uniref:inactive peptidyl-prolyl cis-trans isomerase FKBP6-like n=1 Tax=Portunus trituberculatus TaxID=210409 RepID=UPI001E1D108B|nr:inactive peptidyl-prolyl cis-trans isomerase FKBP6-like [Portunus trituberculatus]